MLVAQRPACLSRLSTPHFGPRSSLSSSTACLPATQRSFSICMRCRQFWAWWRQQLLPICTVAWIDIIEEDFLSWLDVRKAIRWNHKFGPPWSLYRKYLNGTRRSIKGLVDLVGQDYKWFGMIYKYTVLADVELNWIPDAKTTAVQHLAKSF